MAGQHCQVANVVDLEELIGLKEPNPLVLFWGKEKGAMLLLLFFQAVHGARF